MSKIRDNLLVTAGTRAAYMDCMRLISLPGGTIGEDLLAEFVASVCDKYIDEKIDISFDEYIENALTDKYGIDEKKKSEDISNRINDKAYKHAKDCIEICQTAIGKSHERIMELIDDITDERNSYETYKRAIEHNKEIVMRYEIQEEICGNKEK